MKKVFKLTLIISLLVIVGCSRIPKEGDYLVLKAEHKNYNMETVEEDYWISTIFELNRNGELTSKKEYNLSGIKEEKVQLTNEQTTYICSILESQKHVKDYNEGYGGSAWEFNYYNETGKKISDYSGYIYNNESFLELEKNLYSYFED